MNQSISPAASAVGNTGMVATSLWGSDKIGGITVDPDGAIWLGAYSRLGLGGEEDSGFTGSLVRFNANGSLDRHFSGDGKSLLPVALDIEDGGNAAVQPGGSYLVAQYVKVGDTWVSGVSRTLADGNLDTSFGNGGTATVPFYWNDSLGQQASFSVQRDGSFFASAAYPSGEIYIARFDATGALVSSFAEAGILHLPASVGIQPSRTIDVSLQGDGKVLVTGQDTLTRLNQDGTLDSSFANGGSLALDVHADALVLQDDGKILLAGASGGVATVIRLNADGSLDRDFGDQGQVHWGSQSAPFAVADMLVLADGKLLIGASQGTSADGYLAALVQLNPDGSLDHSFGNPDDGYYHLDGSRDDDFLLGTASFDDAIFGGAGNDLLDGQQGRDLLTGGAGADTFRYQSVTDSYRTATTAHSDRITDFDPSTDTIDLASLGFLGLGNGHDGTLAIRVNESGTRTYLKSFDANADGERFEVVFDGDLSQALNETNLLFQPARLMGTEEADRLQGNARGEIIEGFAGDDRLYGALGNDVLVGAAGRDLLTGGGNNDVFRFDVLSDSYRTATENHTDRLVDYTAGEDTIDLSALGFTRLGNGYNGTLDVVFNETKNLTYLKSYEADADGARFELSLVGDHSGYRDLDITFAEPPAEEVFQLIGVADLWV
ncbi:delta-60 repeat domain-containing protein [Pseudomonas sp. NFACC23-1]|uniref:M10 family metallopeptidase C-terminal domain-containing protein n=1 Tax=unclassified Pseudomonas TaxID=196821 RepID=UPI0008824EDC|nr:MULTISPECIES: type I secretion target [unclassified Pseudomonas]SDB04570.1 delta-60 repeat domain-containing protein [Pseudomonas sp. NFACC17-2]SEI79264.1 delta-60 repeat domain-containing protein [Pseudomonas sp. NFACC23-1]SFW19306.1 delta-60 repeat domain-containing protein [Pseudomonas sp. NFACC16-2]